MPFFKKDDNTMYQIRRCSNTAKFVRYLWDVSSDKERSNYRYLQLLVECGWCNSGSEDAWKKWRNKKIANYLEIDNGSTQVLIRKAATNWPKLNESRFRVLLGNTTGMTNARGSYRTVTIKSIKAHEAEIATIFHMVASNKPTSEKIPSTMDLIDRLPQIRLKKKRTAIINYISPSLACLDLDKKFPIINQRTYRLLKSLGAITLADQAQRLVEVIGNHGVNNNMELDVYSYEYGKKFPLHRGPKIVIKADAQKEVGLKPEQKSIANIERERREIKKVHNKIINKFIKYARKNPYYDIQEYPYDILIRNWRKKRALLIEAKTSSTNGSGRTQIRQAIGQLFDYRMNYIEHGNDKVDLALLLPKKPARDVLDLLDYLEIEVLWFNGANLEGTIDI